MSDMETRPAPLPARRLLDDDVPPLRSSGPPPPRGGRNEEMPMTVISEGDVLVGRLGMSGNGQVLGSFDGDITCPGELLIGADARVRADIEAHEVVLAGHVQGNLVVRGRLKITTTGRLDGDAHVGSLI